MNRSDASVATVFAICASLLVPSPGNAHSATDYYPRTWQRDQTIEYRFTTEMPAGSFRGRVRDARDQWNAVNTTLSLHEGATFTPDYAPDQCPNSYQTNGIFHRTIDGPGNTLASTWTCIFSGTDETYSAQIVFDSEEMWYSGTGTPLTTQVDLWAVSSHEFGHVTGFSGPHANGHFNPNDSTVCPESSSKHTMCPTITRGVTWQRDLEFHDSETFENAYPQPPPSSPPSVPTLYGAGHSQAAADFDNDGYGDLAIGIPGEDDAGAVDVGAVQIVYGGPSGLTTRDQLWVQGAGSIPNGNPENGDLLGGALAPGDFDNDGFADLAVSAPGEDRNAGAVFVLYGSGSGLTNDGVQLWRQGIEGLPGKKEAGDRFGAALATGDFNRDGADDLAIGAPFEDNTTSDEGAVMVIYAASPLIPGGTSAGLTAEGSQFFLQEEDGVPANAESGDRFGTTLATGDFDGDAVFDLAVGIPRENVDGKTDAGALVVLFGRQATPIVDPGGLSAAGSQVFDSESPGVGGTIESGDQFAAALAAGDFDNNGRDDLAVGVPNEDLGSVANAGWLSVLSGGPNGLSGWMSFEPDSIGGTIEPGDRFGAALAAGDFDGDSRDDLAVGAPNEDVGSITDAGAVHVVFGSSSGLSASRFRVWWQNKSGAAGTVEASDRFAVGLTAGNFNGSSTGRFDLAVGVPYEDLGSKVDVGTTQVFLGAQPSADAFVDQGQPGIIGKAEAGDGFAAALAG